MRRICRCNVPPLLAFLFFAFAIHVAPAIAADFATGFKVQSVPVDGCTLNVTTGGVGPAVLLIHGYAETSRMWAPLASVLAPRFTVIHWIMEEKPAETISALQGFL